MILLDGPREAALAALAERIQSLRREGTRPGLLLWDEDAARLAPLLPGAALAQLGPEGEPETTARRLYAGLRALEAAGAGAILARLPADEGLGRAVRDRLTRAAGGQVTRL